MKRTLLLATALALAPVPMQRAQAYGGWEDEARLESLDGRISCEGSRTWRANKRRRFWTEGRMCALTRYECLQGLVIDRDGAHRVESCSDDKEWSAGRKADY